MLPVLLESSSQSAGIAWMERMGRMERDSTLSVLHPSPSRHLFFHPSPSSHLFFHPSPSRRRLRCQNDDAQRVAMVGSRMVIGRENAAEIEEISSFADDCYQEASGWRGDMAA